jgi:hypothetical protein
MRSVAGGGVRTGAAGAVVSGATVTAFPGSLSWLTSLAGSIGLSSGRGAAAEIRKKRPNKSDGNTKEKLANCILNLTTFFLIEHDTLLIT